MSRQIHWEGDFGLQKRLSGLTAAHFSACASAEKEHSHCGRSSKCLQRPWLLRFRDPGRSSTWKKRDPP